MIGKLLNIVVCIVLVMFVMLDYVGILFRLW